MSQRKIVIAMDGSDFANHAFYWYLQHMRKPQDDVVIVHCPDYSSLLQPVSQSIGDGEIWERYETHTQRNMELEKDMRKKIVEAQIEGKVLSIYGRPGEMIVRAATQENADFIITGTRGLGKIRRSLLGSVSDYILHHSHIPVLVCPHRERH